MKIFRYLDQSGKMGFGRFDNEGNTFLILQKGDGDFREPDQGSLLSVSYADRFSMHICNWIEL